MTTAHIPTQTPTKVKSTKHMKQMGSICYWNCNNLPSYILFLQMCCKEEILYLGISRYH